MSLEVIKVSSCYIMVPSAGLRPGEGTAGRRWATTVALEAYPDIVMLRSSPCDGGYALQCSLPQVSVLMETRALGTEADDWAVLRASAGPRVSTPSGPAESASPQ